MVAQAKPSVLWDRVRENFQSDDGSLPTVTVANLKGEEVADLYKAIRQGSTLVDSDATFWDRERAQERGLDSVGNAAQLVAKGEAEPFHFAIYGVTVGRVELPCLGIFVLPDSLEVDYRMGVDWGVDEVWSFFSWLSNLVNLAESGELRVGLDGPPDPAGFIGAWRWFLRGSPRVNEA